MNGRRTTSVAILAAMVSVQTAHSGGPPEYEVTAVIAGFECPPFGLAAVNPWALNEAGDVAGHVTCPAGVTRAFRWTAETGLELIPMPPQTSQSRGLAINGSKVVGWFANSNELGITGFLYDLETDQFTSLGTLPGGNWSEAHGINALGQITGFWGNVVKGPSPLAFIWRDGEMIDIHPDFGTIKSEANGITDESVVTGWMGSSTLTDARAFIWDEGNVTQLPEIPDGITSEGEAINNHGDVAGRGRFFDPNLNAFVWRAFAFVDGEAINLGTLPGIEKSVALGINDDQTVVGFAQIPPLRAFVWQDGKMTALNDVFPPGFDLDFNTARGINQAGQIAATAHSDSLNATVGVLLSPVNQGIPGDLDNDGQVGVKDLLILLGDWGSCDNCSNCPTDLDNNCVVGVPDLLILLGNWG